MPLALILNELITNAVKHGVNGRGAGEIRVSMKRGGDNMILAVEDDGPGFEMLSSGGHSSGIGLVRGMTRQLSGPSQLKTAEERVHCSLS